MWRRTSQIGKQRVPYTAHPRQMVDVICPPMLFQCWPTANGAGPTLKQHWVESWCLLGELSAF